MTGLAERLESIERRVFGDYADSYANPDLTNRLAALQSKLDEVEKSIPDHQFCKANTCKYNIYLRDKRVTSLQVSDRAEYLAATRFEIEKNLNYMAIIQSASAVLDEDYFTALLKSDSSIIDKTLAVEEKLKLQLAELNRQTQEMDTLLESYDQLTKAINAKCAAWDYQLKMAEKEKFKGK